MKKEKIMPNFPSYFPNVRIENDVAKIDAGGLYYRDLNALMRSFNGNGVKKMELSNVYGQRYIGTDLDGNTEIEIFGTPGNDLGAFMNGPKIIVHGNVQDGCGNTMDQGEIVVFGRAGDITGYSMRGGKIFVRDNAGYRVGIHMKEYGDKRPFLVIGGTAQDFLGEYMAGGVLVVLGLGLKNGERHEARFVGTGMHGGVMYIQGEVKHLGKEVDKVSFEKEDKQLLSRLVDEFCAYFGFNADEIMNREFTKLIPVSNRPYGTLYAY